MDMCWTSPLVPIMIQSEVLLVKLRRVARMCVIFYGDARAHVCCKVAPRSCQTCLPNVTYQQKCALCESTHPLLNLPASSLHIEKPSISLFPFICFLAFIQKYIYFPFPHLYFFQNGFSSGVLLRDEAIPWLIVVCGIRSCFSPFTGHTVLSQDPQRKGPVTDPSPLLVLFTRYLSAGPPFILASFAFSRLVFLKVP